jgi:hypothetical protein
MPRRIDPKLHKGLLANSTLLDNKRTNSYLMVAAGR